MGETNISQKNNIKLKNATNKITKINQKITSLYEELITQQRIRDALLGLTNYKTGNALFNNLDNAIVYIENLMGCERGSIKSKKRHKEYAFVRSVVCYYLRLEKEIELKRIGYYFNRDHTTIMKAIQRCEDYLYFDNTKKEVKKTLKILRAHCGEL